MAVCGNENTADGEIAEELEILREIYINELSIESNSEPFVRVLSIQLHPSTGEDTDQQWVCLTLQIKLPTKYPHELPVIEIRNPRGLADDHIQSLRSSLAELAEERLGGPMLYELIELAKESLTLSNLPHGQCVVCLDGFEHGEAFTRTHCYHYLHCHCLLRYITHCLAVMEQQQEQQQQQPSAMWLQAQEPSSHEVVCPVCREPITYDLESLQRSSEVQEEVITFKPTVEMRHLQDKMAKLFLRQKEKGGIIDLEEEKNKYLVPSGLVLSGSSSHLESLPKQEMKVVEEVAASKNITAMSKSSRGGNESCKESSKSREFSKQPRIRSSQNREQRDRHKPNGRQRSQKPSVKSPDETPRSFRDNAHSAQKSRDCRNISDAKRTEHFRQENRDGERANYRSRYGPRKPRNELRRPEDSYADSNMHFSHNKPRMESQLRKVNTWPKKSMSEHSSDSQSDAQRTSARSRPSNPNCEPSSTPAERMQNGHSSAQLKCSRPPPGFSTISSSREHRGPPPGFHDTS